MSDLATCGTCGRTWDDSISTGWTPAPGGRCPFEYQHGNGSHVIPGAVYSVETTGGSNRAESLAGKRFADPAGDDFAWLIIAATPSTITVRAIGRNEDIWQIAYTLTAVGIRTPSDWQSGDPTIPDPGVSSWWGPESAIRA